MGVLHGETERKVPIALIRFNPDHTLATDMRGIACGSTRMDNEYTLILSSCTSPGAGHPRLTCIPRGPLRVICQGRDEYFVDYNR